MTMQPSDWSIPEWDLGRYMARGDGEWAPGSRAVPLRGDTIPAARLMEPDAEPVAFTVLEQLPGMCCRLRVVGPDGDPALLFLDTTTGAFWVMPFAASAAGDDWEGE